MIATKYTFFLSWIAASILFSVAIFGYIKTEILTFLFIDEIESDKFCRQQSESDLKYVKVIEYRQVKNTAKIVCIYKDSKQNQELELNYNEDWKVIIRRKLNQEKNTFYWPIYR